MQLVTLNTFVSLVSAQPLAIQGLHLILLLLLTRHIARGDDHLERAKHRQG